MAFALQGQSSVSCSGQSTTSNTTQYIEKIQELGHEDRRKTIAEFADAAEISDGVCQAILPENVNMCHVVAKFVILYHG
jgi:hypothetical protein